MYYDHFGLSQPPFKITPNTEFFFGAVASLDRAVIAFLFRIAGQFGNQCFQKRSIHHHLTLALMWQARIK